MDINQRKLNKTEWTNIELPILENEKAVLNIICSGYHDVNIRYNRHISLFGYLKIEFSQIMDDYLFFHYFQPIIDGFHKYGVVFDEYKTMKSIPIIKKADQIRLQKNEANKLMNNMEIYEYLLLSLVDNILKNKQNTNNWCVHYFTLYKLITMNILQLNIHVMSFIRKNIIEKFESELNMIEVIQNSVEFIEKNKLLLQYSDITLYEHQRELFMAAKNTQSKLILYIAPTGTGKTLSPIGLSEGYTDCPITKEHIKHRIIFVCAARHVGLALAKSAISMGKKIAFAFGCDSAADIRLHYFAAKEYTKHRKSGGIGKVDNSVGDKVEIMICDVKSYLPAMYYMLSFNKANNIITYWDEPTITMDYEDHELHSIIHENWTNNLIPNMVLSSATLPKLYEIETSIQSFRTKFPDAEIHNIVSYDSKKSIPIVNKFGYVIVPHLLSADPHQIQLIVENCRENMTILRYLDLSEIIKFISYILSKIAEPGLNERFRSIADINMSSIKLYYIDLLESLVVTSPQLWARIYNHLNLKKQRRIESNTQVDLKGVAIRKSASLGASSVIQQPVISGAPLSRTQSVSDIQPVKEEQTGIYVTTKDSFTLTDGPTIFLTNDVEKIAKFYIQQSNIPDKVMSDILEKITLNNTINDKIEELEQELELLTEKSVVASSDGDGGNDKNKKKNKVKLASDSNSDGRSIAKLENEIERYRQMIQSAQLNDILIPNKPLHLKKWGSSDRNRNEKAFTSDIDENTIVNIMMLKDVDDSWKVLLLMGIGVFTNHPSIAYTEIIKRLANEQKLYMIIASSDYIYGTNYQFCHGYLAKDLSITQEKIIQAFGRIGRNNIQQDYTIRLRDETQINKLFYKEENKPEVRNMAKLFC